MKKIVNSPYLLVTIPLILGGMWLVLHPEIITNNLNKPYALLAGPALVGSILLGWLFVAFFKTISAWCKGAWQSFQAWRKQDGSTFWLVIYIFLIVSVLESGTYFNELLGSNSLYGSLGYAAAFVVDLIAVECMRARLGATRMRDKTGKRIYLLGVVACAGLSAWANTYTSLSHYRVPTNPLLPVWMVTLAPWTGMAFPLLIILMSFAADYTADQTSTKLDPENYQTQEDKRFKLLEIQRDMLRKRVEVEREIDMLSSRSKIVRGPLALFVKKQQVVENVLEAISPQIEMLLEQNKALHNQLANLTNQSQQTQELHRQDRAIIDHQIEAIRTQRDVDMEALTRHVEETITAAISNGLSGELEVLKSQLYQEQNTDDVEAVGVDNLEENEEVDEETQKALLAYPIFLQKLSTGVRSLSLQDIIDDTGHSHQRVHMAHKNKAFRGTRKPGYYRIDSVVEWLKLAPLPRATNRPITDEIAPVLSGDNPEGNSADYRAHNSRSNGHSKDTINLDNFTQLGVN